MIDLVIMSDDVVLSNYLNDFKDALESIGGTDISIGYSGHLVAHIPKGTTYVAVADAVDGIGGQTELWTTDGMFAWKNLSGSVEDGDVGLLKNVP